MSQSSNSSTCSSNSVCSNCRFPGRCPLAVIPDLVSKTRRLLEWRYYGRNCVVYRQDQPAAGIFLVHSGWLKLYYVGPSGRRVSVGVAGPGSVLGVGEIVSCVPNVATAETGEETEMEYLAASHLHDCLRENPTLGVELLRVVTHQTRGLLSQILGSGSVPADRRLWKMLVDLSKSSGYSNSGVEIKLQISIQDLSDQIGCSRQWTSKLLGDLEAKGWIRRTAGWIVLCGDPAKKRRPKVRRLVAVRAAS